MAIILVVDDSITARAFCRKVLGPAGHEILEAATGRDALARVADRRPDCVVLDLLMPDMSGIELLEALDARGDRPPVVVLTADIQESVREQCRALRVDAFLNKPAAPDALRSAVAAAVGGASRP